MWQTEYAAEPGPASAGSHHRGPARHRKPPAWRRAAARGLVPFAGLAALRQHVRLDPGRLTPLPRWR
ncbi:MAG TPA: hypothetical protein VGS19_04995 [Streptosporangiaceae bacterium]|nr:hypothetical protein [Streptosporangiaceae bacterium]